MFKNEIIKHTHFYFIAIISTLIFYTLNLIFTEYHFVEIYFHKLTLSMAVTILAGLALVIRLILNMMNLEPNNFLKKILTFFINKISICFIGIFGFCTGMIILNIIYGHYEIITLYFSLGILGLLYGSATIFLNVKLQIHGYLT